MLTIDYNIIIFISSWPIFLISVTQFVQILKLLANTQVFHTYC